MSFDLSLYNDEFFQWHYKYARIYSIQTMNWFLDKFTVSSVVDFGCGIGSYLECAHDRGLEVKGFEIQKQQRNTLLKGFKSLLLTRIAPSLL